MKVTFLRNVGFEDASYERGQVYDLPEDKVKALGDDVEPVHEAKQVEPKTMAVEHAPKDKMVHAAPKAK